MRATVFLNTRAGSFREESSGARLRQLFASYGVEADVKTAFDLGHGRSEELSASEMLVAAGGDGTVNAVANVAVAADLPLGVLPLGTLNHFAHDIGLPLTIEKAVGVIAARSERRVDVGEANGRVFVNNSSIGLYPELVRKRDDRRSRLGKWPAMVLAALSILRRFPQTRIRLRARGNGVDRMTPILFVGNNRYQSTRRERLDEGVLAVYIAHVRSAAGLFRLALRGLIGRLDRATDLELYCIPEVVIESPRRSVRVAVDGEVERLAAPLEYRIRARALRVLMPPNAPGA
jgi:diacylglycerol kinase family enzyme